MTTTQFKVGDKVKIKGRFSGGPGWVQGMEQYIGGEAEVVKVWADDKDIVMVKPEGTFSHYVWTVATLENLTAKAAQKAKHEAEKQAKAGINGPVKFRNFMRVVTRKGETLIVVPAGSQPGSKTPLAFVDKQNCWMAATMTQTRTGLSSDRFWSQFDVIAIYAAPAKATEMLDFTMKGELLWSEEEQKRKEEEAETQRQQKLVKIAALKAEIAQLESEI